MRFTLIKNLKKDRTMKPIISGLLLFMLLFVIADVFVKHSLLGVTPQNIGYTLYGDEEEFLDPITESSLLEIWHSDIFFTMLILLTLSAVYARVVNSYKSGVIIINALMFFAFISLVSLVLSYYVSSVFIYSYISCFYLWHILSLYMIGTSLVKLYD